MTALYTIMFAVMRGWFVLDNHNNPSDREMEEGETEGEKEMKAVAKLLIL